MILTASHEVEAPAVSQEVEAPAGFMIARAFPDAFTLRCFAFAPTEAQVEEDRKEKSNLIMFPPGECRVPRAEG